MNVRTPVVPPVPVDPKPGLPKTGAESPLLPLGVAGLALLAVGGALVATRLRKS